MLTENRVVGKIEVLEDETIQIREDRVILDDGREIARIHQVRALIPGSNVDREDPRVRRIAQLLWTNDVIDAVRIKKQTALDRLLGVTRP